MGIKAALSKPLAAYTHYRDQKWMREPEKAQEAIFQQILKQAGNTVFGKDHGFANIKTHADYIKAVPVRDYEALKPYFDRVKNGEPDVLWPGKPIYLAKTSGTTSGTKYIPITFGYQIHSHYQSLNTEPY
jgi:hypothetical protein